LRNLEQYLLTADPQAVLGFAQHGAHTSYLVILEGGVGVLAKPADEAGGNGPLWARHEAAAWEVAKALGWADLLSVTVHRQMRSEQTGTQVEASFQVLWPRPEVAPPLDSFTDEEVWRAAVFDALLAHGDRGGHNWLGVPERTAGTRCRLKLIDHGIAFGSDPVPPSSAFYSNKVDQVLPSDVADGLRRLLGSMDSLKATGLLDDGELQGLVRRAEILLARGRLRVA
jgi:hypothetical protein